MIFSVDPEKCNRDRMCVEACGRKLIEINAENALPAPILGAEELCIKCGHCVAVCPTGALTHRTMGTPSCPEIKKDLFANAEQVEQLLRFRRSHRIYRNKTVEREKMEKLIRAAGYAPSGRNARPVHLLIIENKENVRQISALTVDWIRTVIQVPEEEPYLDMMVKRWEKGEDPICRNAPHLIFAHAAENERMAPIDCVLALAYAEFCALSLNLGTTWAGYVMAATKSYLPMAEVLQFPKGNKCFGAIMVGYPKLRFARMPLRNPPKTVWR